MHQYLKFIDVSMFITFFSLRSENLREKEIEALFKHLISNIGGLCYKFMSFNKGVPDRVAIIPNKGIYFIELKKKGGRLSPLQSRTIEDMKSKGANVEVIEGVEGVYKFLKDLNLYDFR